MEALASQPRGISHTWFEGNLIQYPEPIQPWMTKTRTELVAKFGQSNTKFNTLTLASQATNNFK